MDIKYVLNSN